MSLFRHISSIGRRPAYTPLLAAVFVAGQLALSSVQAATLGHSRLVSAAGEPLHITIPVTQISDSELSSLRAVPAPAPEWSHAGLTPPVDLTTLRTRISQGHAPGTHVLQIRSDATFNQPIADLLLDIHTSSGVQRYQVSLLSRGGTTAIQAPSAQTSRAVGDGAGADRAGQTIDQKPVLVRRGDTMFAVAGRHAVPNVSVYQMMIALQRANPHAFIHDNVNLVKAGAQLAMPDMTALTALSDREARRLFHEQVVAFNAYRQGSGGSVAADPAAVQSLTPHKQDVSSVDAASNIPQSRTAEGDQLRLSSGRVAGAAGTQSANGAVADPAQTGAQLAIQTNGTLNSLAQNMASGVSKTAHAATADGATIDAPGSQTNNQTSMAGTSSNTDAAPVPDSALIAGSTAATGAAASAAATASAASATANSVSADGATDASASTPVSAGADASTGTMPSGQPGNATPLDEDALADDAMAARKAISDAEQRVSQLEENVKNLNQALQSQGEAAKDVVIEGALGLRKSLTDVATAVTDATIGDEEYLNGSTDSAQADEASTTGDASEAQQTNTTRSAMDSIINWLQANLIAVITGALALIVLLIAWVLRRENISQARTESAVTPEMVKEKLEQINLDLNEPTINDSPSSR